MPSYEYTCPCGNRKVVIKSMIDASLPEYCECSQQSQMERVFTASSVEVKGGTPKFHRRSQK